MLLLNAPVRFIIKCRPDVLLGLYKTYFSLSINFMLLWVTKNSWLYFILELKETHHRRQHLFWWILGKGFVESQTKDNNRCDHQQDTHQNANGKPHVKQIWMELSQLDKGPVEACRIPSHLAYWKGNAIVFQKLFVSPWVFSIILKTRTKE